MQPRTPPPALMTFKDCLAADVQQVFFNLEEYGEKRTLNGREMPAIVDRN